MRTRSAVLYEGSHQAEVVELELKPPQQDEVLVRVVNAGVCHSDLHVLQGKFPGPRPVVLGHEGAGVVEAVGEAVKTVKPGDRVILLWRTPCNHCYYCSIGRPALCDEFFAVAPRGSMPDGSFRFFQGKEPINHFNLTSCMSEYTVMKGTSVMPIPADFPLDIAAVIGCAVITGVGAVVNTAQVRPGSTVAIFGAGGVGLSGVMGAALCNASQIIAVDVKANKLEMAREMGATHTVNAAEVDPVEAIRELTGGRGVEFAFEMIGLTSVMEQAYDATARGGTTVIVGVAPPEARFPISAKVMQLQERRVQGSLYGSSRHWADLPLLARLYREGKLPLDKLITRHYPLDQINEAFAALEAGEVARSVLDITSG